MTNREKLIEELKKYDRAYSTPQVPVSLVHQAITELEKPDILEILENGGFVHSPNHTPDGAYWGFSDEFGGGSLFYSAGNGDKTNFSNGDFLFTYGDLKQCNPDPVEGSLDWAKAQHNSGAVVCHGVGSYFVLMQKNDHFGPYFNKGVYKTGWSLHQEPKLETGWYWIQELNAIEEGPRPCFCDARSKNFSPLGTEVLRNPDGTPMKIEIPGGE